MRVIIAAISIYLSICAGFIDPSIAQKKNFTYDQVFNSPPAGITKSLPLITGWADDEHSLELMVYPAERHSIGANEPAKSVHNKMEAYRFYYQYLLNKPLPDVFMGKSGQQSF